MPPGVGVLSMQECIEVTTVSTGWAYILGTLYKVTQSLHLYSGEVSFSGLVLPNDRVNSESVVGIKPGDNNVVIGY